jgi:hypothetical protein
MKPAELLFAKADRSDSPEMRIGHATQSRSRTRGTRHACGSSWPSGRQAWPNATARSDYVLNHLTETGVHRSKMAWERPEQTGHERRDVPTAFFEPNSSGGRLPEPVRFIARGTRPDSPGDAHPGAARHPASAADSPPRIGRRSHERLKDEPDPGIPCLFLHSRYSSFILHPSSFLFCPFTR